MMPTQLHRWKKCLTTQEIDAWLATGDDQVMRLDSSLAFHSKREHNAACLALCAGDVMAYERWLGSEVEKLFGQDGSLPVLLLELDAFDSGYLRQRGIIYHPDLQCWYAFPGRSLDGMTNHLPLRWREAYRRLRQGCLGEIERKDSPRS
jgi:hypothetical protein